MQIVDQNVKLLWITENPEQEIEAAGRTCYKSEDKITPTSAGVFVKKLKDSGHHAMIEHAVASFRITTDRGVSHEIVRHRIASFAQESTRYVRYGGSNELKVIEPPNLSFDARNAWAAACEMAEYYYLSLLERGCAPQIARSVLPTCTKTELVMTANLREWMHFITLRESPAAHPQIQEIARQIREILVQHAPSIFG